MKLNHDRTGRRRMNSVPMLVVLMLTSMLIARSAIAQTQLADSKPAEPKPNSETYQTFYLTNLTQQNDANEILNDLRNMLPKAKLYYMPAQDAISIRATPDDMLLAQKVLTDMDRAKKIYRLTYTITETDSGKGIGTQHFALIVVSGGKAVLKQGSKVPIVTGSSDAGTSTRNSQVQYVDVGLNIEASLDGGRLRTKVEQSSVADQKPGGSVQDPVIFQTALEGTSTLVQGEPLVLGKLDIPGSTRHQEIEVVSEPVR
jgi:type II secretory pathway component GspD/PulD (secretin)